MMITYYWEGKAFHRCGKFEATNDEEALSKTPPDTVLLYKESDTEDGLPFITLMWRPDA
jgi:hypothetical protein